ncbi:A-kinase anchor protein 8-like [Erinaceus europaeus]|uniref:A-kinase anchor protein 8-like n=1 Tax=Erinaceus europaeus TaxID=9365 RepID=A0ABM3WNZ9_ERIEU|nr:A-kinase anchor protein 8-like [Erinaceus europaeus]
MSYTGFVQGSETTLQSTYSDSGSQPTCDYGYGSWNSGSGRGYDGYGYGYGYGHGQESSSGPGSGYGYGPAAPGPWTAPRPGSLSNPAAGRDPVLCRMSQRDVLPDNDGHVLPLPGGVYGAGAESSCLWTQPGRPREALQHRYEAFEAPEPRPGPAERERWPGYDYGGGEPEPDADAAFEGQPGAYRDQFRRAGGGSDGFGLGPGPGPRTQGWRDPRAGRAPPPPPPPPPPSEYARAWEDPLGARGQCLPGASRLPSLFAHNIIPDYGGFPARAAGAFPAGSRPAPGSGFGSGFGFGNGMKQLRPTWKTWTKTDFRVKRKKRKQPGNSEGPEAKAARTDGSENSDSDNGEADNDEGTEGEAAAEGAEGAEATEKAPKPEEDEEGKEAGKEGARDEAERGPPSAQDEGAASKRKQLAAKKTQDRQKRRQRDRMVERIQFVCSLCKFRTFYEDEMAGHMDSRFHKEHFKYVGTKLPKQTADFLQEYVTSKTKKTEELRKNVENLDALIQHIYRDQDLTLEIAMEHFVRKVEAVHCAACDLFIPMQSGIIQKHLKTTEHNRNRRVMLEQSKKSSLMVARSILNNKLIGQKLERFQRGENPFVDSPEEEKEPEPEPEPQEAQAGGLEEAAQPPAPPEGEGEGEPLLGGALQRRVRGIPGLDVEADDDEEAGGAAP